MSDYQIETRRRSRSKTPFLRSSCDHENCEFAGEEGHSHHHHQKKKAPNVQTIVEETVEVTSSISPTKQTQKAKTSDYSSEDTSPESKSKKITTTISEESSQKSKQMSSSVNRTTTTTTTNTSVITKSKRAAATSTPKAIQNYLLESFASQFTGGAGSHIAEQRFKEITQNALNTEFERSQRSAAAAGLGSNNSSASKSYSHILHNSNGDLSDHIAYQEYKRAGEYWNTTPKTDYTYSEHSSFRRELAPGIVAMPNMSRYGLKNHSDRINYMIERDPTQEEFIRRRYESSRYAQNRKATEKLTYDSGDELDYQLDSYRKRQYNRYLLENQESWYMRIITTIITTITSAWTMLSGGGGVGGGGGMATGYDSSSFYRTKHGQVERGFFGSIAHGISASISRLFRYVYLLISSVLCLDTWLLQSSNADGKGKKRFLLLLLVLLPLLLLSAWWLLGQEERTYLLQRTEAFVPLSMLVGWQSALYAIGSSFKGYLLQLPDNVKSSVSQYYTSYVGGAESGGGDAHLHIHNIEQRLQKALTTEEYENILNHVNSYVQQLIDLKLAKQQREQSAQVEQLSQAQIQLIVQLMRENLERLSLEKQQGSDDVKLATLSEGEVLRLAELVSVQLEAKGWLDRPVSLSGENLREIKRLITEQMEMQEHKHYVLLLERIDLDALLARILSTPQFGKYVDERIATAFESKQWQAVVTKKLREGSGNGETHSHQQRLIDELNNEIAFIKLALSDKLNENEGLHQSISKLKVTQDDLLKRMQEHELATDQRFSGLLADIESKLAALKDDHFKLLNQQIKLSLVEILGFKDKTFAGANLEDIDLQNWVRSMFVAKDYLEERLLALNKGTDNKIRDEIDRSGMLLMRDISERLKHEILIAVEAKHNESVAALNGQIHTALSEEEVHKIVKSVLAIYDADKTGLVDFALESAGGQILSTRCTENYQTKSAQISIFGIPLWYPTNTPRIAISPHVQPGECWAFQGFPGFLVLKLNSMVYVTGFTLEHIPRSLSPNGRIDSAPRNFTVWGLEHEKDYEPVLFGEFEYVDNDASLQYFPVKNKDIKRPYEIVELRIESNHGHAQYTCLYRFRVHGKPPAV
ncbi:klaroid protein isoform X1 [Anastrepha obliqua]|uniref:klaroid protein isoform X1 n=2 Tax=Anastrepha obliqua TaxID=95512 RepID=UPI002409A752|nr:klaroid protein isoform X1 [Anastrepha obliqua]